MRTPPFARIIAALLLTLAPAIPARAGSPIDSALAPTSRSRSVASSAASTLPRQLRGPADENALLGEYLAQQLRAQFNVRGVITTELTNSVTSDISRGDKTPLHERISYKKLKIRLTDDDATGRLRDANGYCSVAVYRDWELYRIRCKFPRVRQPKTAAERAKAARASPWRSQQSLCASKIGREHGHWQNLLSSREAGRKIGGWCYWDVPFRGADGAPLALREGRPVAPDYSLRARPVFDVQAFD